MTPLVGGPILILTQAHGISGAAVGGSPPVRKGSYRKPAEAGWLYL